LKISSVTKIHRLSPDQHKLIMKCIIHWLRRSALGPTFQFYTEL